jgi:hypothetical protein
MKKFALLLSSLGVVGLSVAIFAAAQEPAPPAFERGNSTATAEGQNEAREPEEDGEDFDADLPKQIQVQVEFIELSHEALTKLLFKSKPVSADATKLREQLQEMVEKKEANVLETMIAIAKSGQKATTESIHEFIYPTEYEPNWGLPDADGKTQPPPAPTKPQNIFPAVPVSFEPRNLGSTLEIEPTLSNDDLVIDLRFAPEIIWHTGNTSWMKGKDLLGNDYDVLMPNMYVLRLSTGLSCYNGKYHLAGVVSPKDEKGNTDHKRKVMVLVKCDVLTVK